jgi:KDO2-lipid IV(A) lauroyltransferase
VSLSLVDLGYAAAWRAVRLLPESAAGALFRAGADRAYGKNGRGVQRLRENLARVLGPEASSERLERTVQVGMRSYARYWMEAFRLPSWSRARLNGSIEILGIESLRDAYAQGRGVVVALPHAGNWDHAGAWACQNGFELTTVAERLKPEALFERFVAYRESLGIEILPTHGGERPPLEVLSERLTQGRMVVLVAERDMGAGGVPVSFFDGTIRVPAGPSLLAARTGAILLTADLWYEPERSMVRLAPLELTEAPRLREVVTGTCQRVADRFAAGIAEHPEDWHMLQRLWVETPAAQDA